MFMLINHELGGCLPLVAPCCQPPITDITDIHKRLIIGLACGVTHVGLDFRLSETVSDQAQQLSVPENLALKFFFCCVKLIT